MRHCDEATNLVNHLRFNPNKECDEIMTAAGWRRGEERCCLGRDAFQHVYHRPEGSDSHLSNLQFAFWWSNNKTFFKLQNAVLLNCLICFVTLIKHLSSVNRVTSCHWARPSSPLSSAVFIHVDMKNERPDAKMEHSPSNSAGPTPTIIMERGSDAACTGMTINHQFD